MARSREQIETVLTGGLIELLRGVFGKRLLSVTVYGSFLRESFRPGSSDVNILVILSEREASRIRALGESGYRTLKKNRITPLILTQEEFFTSADVFPMEYLDIVENHRLLHGQDVTGELTISKENLRHEVEHQLRGSLVALRQLAVAGSRKRPFMAGALRREVEQWYGSLAAVFRGVLRLKSDAAVPHDPKALVGEVNRAFALDSGPFLAVLQCREGKCPEITTLIDQLLDRLSTLVALVDELGES
jgi:predicted nucleotidyltransferase